MTARISGGYDSEVMGVSTNVRLNPAVRRALKARVKYTGQSATSFVNTAVQRSLREDAIDREAIRRRASEPVIPYREVVKNLKRAGRL